MISNIQLTVIACVFMILIVFFIPLSLFSNTLRKKIRYPLRMCIMVTFKYPNFLFTMIKLVFAKWIRCKIMSVICRRYRYPEICVLQLTTKCNNACAFCLSQHNEATKCIALEKLREHIALLKNNGTVIFIFIGGEPLLYTHLFDVIKENNDAYFIIVTNGKDCFSLVEFLRNQRNCLCFISMQSTEAETIRIRGNAASKDCLALAEKLCAESIPFGISLVLTKQNLFSMRQMCTYDYFQNRGAAIVWTTPYLPMGYGSHNEFILSLSEIDSFYNWLDEIRINLRMIVIGLLSQNKNMKCSAGKHIIYLDAELNLFPCMYLTQKIGNGKYIKESLENWHNSNCNNEECLARKYIIEFCLEDNISI